MRAISAPLLTGLMVGLFSSVPALSVEPYAAEQSGDLYASTLIGMRIYSSEKDWDTLRNDARAPAEREWQDIGEVDDIILNRDNSVRGVLVGVGGFLGIGEKNVAIPLNQIKFVRQVDDADDWFLVVNTNKEALTNLPAYKRLDGTMAPASPPAVDDSAARPKELNVAEQRGSANIEMSSLSPDKLKGARLYSANDEHIGEVDQVLSDADNNINRIVVDVGGFLGLGEHRIAVSPNELTAKVGPGDDVQVYISDTKEELEKRPAYTQ